MSAAAIMLVPQPNTQIIPATPAAVSFGSPIEPPKPKPPRYRIRTIWGKDIGQMRYRPERRWGPLWLSFWVTGLYDLFQTRVTAFTLEEAKAFIDEHKAKVRLSKLKKSPPYVPHTGQVVWEEEEE